MICNFGTFSSPDQTGGSAPSLTHSSSLFMMKLENLSSDAAQEVREYLIAPCLISLEIIFIYIMMVNLVFQNLVSIFNNLKISIQSILDDVFFFMLQCILGLYSQ